MNAQRTADAQRRAELARIHASAHALGLDDDSYRALLERITGERSAASIGAAGRAAVIAELTRLGAPSRRTGAAGKVPRALDRSAYLRKIDALLSAGNKPWEYAHVMGKRMFGRDRVDFLAAADLRKLVAALAIDARRKAAKPRKE